MAGLFSKKGKKDKDKDKDQKERDPRPSNSSHSRANNAATGGGHSKDGSVASATAYSNNAHNNNGHLLASTPEHHPASSKNSLESHQRLMHQHGHFASATSISTHNSLVNSSTTGPWTEASVLATNPFPRFAHTASFVSTGADIYVFGGIVKGSPQRDVYVVDSQTLHCQTLQIAGSDAPPAMSGQSAVTLGHYIMYFGGKDAKGRSGDSLYVLHTIRKEWNKPVIQGHLPPPRHSHTASVIGTTMYIFGGRFNGYYLSDMASFDMKSLNGNNPRWNKIEPAGPTPPARAGHCAAVYDGRIYIFGGADDQYFYNDIWCFDPAFNRWEAVPAYGVLPTSRQGHAACVLDDTMYIFGGMNHEDQMQGDLCAFKFNDKVRYSDPVAHIQRPPPAYELEPARHDVAADPQVVLARPSPTPPEPTNGRDDVYAGMDNRRPVADDRDYSKQDDSHVIQQARRRTIGKPIGALGPTIEVMENRRATYSLDEARPTQVYTDERTGGGGWRSADASIDSPIATSKEDYDSNATNFSTSNHLPRNVIHSPRKPSLENLPRSTMSSPRPTESPLRSAIILEEHDMVSRDTSATASPSTVRSKDDEIKDLRRRELWLMAEVSMARKKNVGAATTGGGGVGLGVGGAMEPLQSLHQTLPMLQDELKEIDVDSNKYRILQALLTVKAQLEHSKAQIATQAQVASSKLREAERVRTSALQEAAYLKAKVNALQTGETSALVATETARAADLEKRLTLALAETTRLQAKESQYETRLEHERQLRRLAEERTQAATLRAEEAQSAHTRSLNELSTLHDRATLAEEKLHEYEAKYATSEAGLSSYQQQSTALFSQISTLKTTVEHQQKSLEKAKLAYSVANDRAEHADRLWTQSRQEIDHMQLDLSSLRAELDRAQREAEHYRSKSDEVEQLWQKAKSESEAMRVLLEEDMNNSSNMHSVGKDRKHDSIMVITSASRVAELEHELGTLRQLLRESQSATAKANKDLGEALLRLSKTEQSAMNARAEAAAYQKELVESKDRLSMLQSELEHKELELEEKIKEQENNEVQLGLLKGVMRSNGLLEEDLILEALSQGVDGKPASPTNIAVANKELKARAEKAESHASEVETRLEDTLALNKAQDERIQQLEADYQTAVHYVQGSEAMVRKLKEDSQASLSEKESLQVELSSLQQLHANCASNNANSAGEAASAEIIKDLEQEVSHLHHQLELSQDRAVEMEKRIEETLSALEESITKTDNLQTELKTLKTKHHEHKKRGQQQTDMFETKVGELEKSLEESQTTSQKTRELLEQSQSELHLAQEMHEQTQLQLKEARASIENESAAANAESVSSERLLELEHQLQEAQSTIQRLQAWNQDLERQVRESENKISLLLDNYHGGESVRHSIVGLSHDDIMTRLMDGGATKPSTGADRSSVDSLANELELLKTPWGQAQINGSVYLPTTTATTTTTTSTTNSADPHTAPSPKIQEYRRLAEESPKHATNPIEE
ncbi:Negative regulator of mitotic exit [Actinomortierella ambigua]|nr:Negative regulator of mitotic exit [Actinomortierella ambigua]